MTFPIQVVVAPHFHLPAEAADHLLVATDAGWRSPAAAERAALVPQNVPADQAGRLLLLFNVPGHLRAAFWKWLERPEGAGGFDAFVAEVGRFLAFKQLPPPERAVLELVVHGAGGQIEPRGLWAVVNLGDEAVALGVAGVRVILGGGEGIRLPEEVAAEVIPPVSESPDVLLVVRRPDCSASPGTA